jgi:hypothetical protein
VDFACKLKVTFRNYIAAWEVMLLQEGTHAAMKGVRLLVNWMHGSSHDLPCQVTNMGRYALAAGRKVGENIEQLWSQLKVGEAS